MLPRKLVRFVDPCGAGSSVCLCISPLVVVRPAAWALHRTKGSRIDSQVILVSAGFFFSVQSSGFVSWVFSWFLS